MCCKYVEFKEIKIEKIDCQYNAYVSGIKVVKMLEDSSEINIFEANNQQIGEFYYSIFIDSDGCKFFHLDDFKIYPEFRCQKYGKSSFIKICETASKLGCAYLAGECTSDNLAKGIKFYKNNGCYVENDKNIKRSVRHTIKKYLN